MMCIKYLSLHKCQTCFGDLSEISPTLESLHESEDMSSLFSYLDVKIINGLPNCICAKCVDTFKNIISFKHQCAESQNILLNLYNQQVSTKEEVKCPKSLEPAAVSLVDNDIKDEESVKEELVEPHVKVEIEEVEELVDCTNDGIEIPLNDANEEPFAPKESSLLQQLLERQQRRVKFVREKGEICSIRCTKCNFSCDTKIELDNHSQEKHDTVCNICNMKFARHSNLRRHQIVHQTDRPKYYCKICKKFYESKDTYDCHVRKFHSNKPREKIVCSICGVSVYAIKEHVRIMHSNRKDKNICKYCEKVFKLPKSLRTHVLEFHENVASYQSLCPECGQVFGTPSKLKSHLYYMHSDERKFSCHHCDKTFKGRYRRNHHEKIVHFKERPYKCEICNKGFTERSVLTTHIRTHTGEKPFVCELCSRPFGARVTLRTHLKLVHRIEKKKPVTSLE